MRRAKSLRIGVHHADAETSESSGSELAPLSPDGDGESSTIASSSSESPAPAAPAERRRDRRGPAGVSIPPLRVDVGVEFKGVRRGVERRRGRGLNARDPGRRDATAKVLKDRRSPRERDRMGTGVMIERACGRRGRC